MHGPSQGRIDRRWSRVHGGWGGRCNPDVERLADRPRRRMRRRQVSRRLTFLCLLDSSAPPNSCTRTPQHTHARVTGSAELTHTALMASSHVCRAPARWLSKHHTSPDYAMQLLALLSPTYLEGDDLLATLRAPVLLAHQAAVVAGQPARSFLFSLLPERPAHASGGPRTQPCVCRQGPSGAPSADHLLRYKLPT